MKINYTTCYDTNNAVCGYVMANEYMDGYSITEDQYNRALKNRTIGGTANIKFICDKPVYVLNNYGDILYSM
jgi:hypothetical protein